MDNYKEKERQRIEKNKSRTMVLSIGAAIMIFLAFIIPLYVTVFAKKDQTRTTLLAAVEEQNLALPVETDMTDLTVYRHHSDGNYSGRFEISVTIPTGVSFDVTDLNNHSLLTSSQILSNRSNRTSVLYFRSPDGGDVKIRYRNSSANNVITRIEVII